MNQTSEKDSLQRIFDFIIHVIGMTYNKVSTIPMDFLTELHLRLGKQNKNSDKKILACWDFNQRTGKLGDFMIFLETLSVLRERFGLDLSRKNIDVCFVDDKSHYNAKLAKFAKTYEFKKNLASVVSINPYIDSVFYFTSNEEFERFYFQNKDKYVRWPGTVSGTATYDVRIIEKYHAETGKLPKFHLPKDVLSDVYEFYEQHVFPAKPVVFNIRKNIRQNDKNSNINEIKKFFKHYEKNKEYKFIVICNKSEIPEDFRELKNVIFSKDHFNTVEYDLGLIKTAYFNIFPRSGMSAFAWYSDVPFIQYGTHSYDVYSTPMKQHGLNHFTAYQKFYIKNENAELLISWFEDLVKCLKRENVDGTSRDRVKKTEYVSKF